MRMTISLRHIDRPPDLIVREPTGITWVNQSHGVLCMQSEAEGFVIPLGVTRDQQATLDSVWGYGGNKARGRAAYLAMINTTENVLREAIKWSPIGDLEILIDQPQPNGLDPDVYLSDQPVAWAEAWLECRFTLRVDDDRPDRPPARWEERTGVITWGNSD